MITMLLPCSSATPAAGMVHGQRGAVVGAVATMGVVVGADMPMFLGAMIIGPLAAYILKLFDELIEDRIKPGFEMLVDNFSRRHHRRRHGDRRRLRHRPGRRARHRLRPAAASSWLVDHDLLPLASVLIEPAKVLFLNNAINHGVLGPLGVAEAAEHRQVDPVHARVEPRPRPRPAAGLPVLRPARAAAQRARRDRSSTSSAASTRSTSRTC